MEAGLALRFLPNKKSWFRKAGAACEQELFHSREKELSGSPFSAGFGVEGVNPWVLAKGRPSIFPLKVAIIKHFLFA